MAMKRRKLQKAEAAGEEALEPGHDPRKKKGDKASPVAARMERCGNPDCRKRVELRLLRPCPVLLRNSRRCTLESLCGDCAKPSGHQCIPPEGVISKSMRRRARGGGSTR